jgi:alkanesulfonate monooxygenase SsuD/methylene tetrahydromethanopterin reductase-like flavin-dependent oxidoreductase (luciferase family)
MNDADKAVRIGVQLPTRERAIIGDCSMAPLLKFGRQVERLGFDSLWTGDSLTARPRLDPIVVLAAVAAVTERITLGTAAFTAALRHPLIGANLIVSLQHAAASRLEVGLGSGFPIPESADEFAAVGVPFEARAARLDEIVRLWRTAWRDNAAKATSFSGKYWQIDGLDRLPSPASPGGPRLWLAGGDTPRVLRRVATLYDGWLPFLPSPEAYEQAWRRIGELAGDNGRPPGSIVPGLYATINVDPDPARGRAELERYVGEYYSRTLESMTSIQAYHHGSAADCAHWLTEYVDAGARHIVLRIGTLDAASQLHEVAEVRRLVREVAGVGLPASTR